MKIDAVLRAARILQSQPGYSMPLVQLHAQLVRELGPEACSYGEIYQQLCKHRDSFAMMNSPRLLGATDSWPGLVREAYEDALDGVGLGSCIRVTLTETETRERNSDLITALSATLAELTARAEGDETLTTYVEAATHELAAMNAIVMGAETGLPTIPLPDLPPSV
jgi:hypothetical protein